jgi:hypothetical protein
MVLEVLQGQGAFITIALIAAIIVSFVVAFKIMEMVFDTIVISLLSGGFYLAMRYIQGGGISLNDLLLFSFLGATLYMVYSTVASAYRLGSTVIPLPYKALRKLLKPLEYVFKKLKEEKKAKNSGGGKSTKEVVLGSQDED